MERHYLVRKDQPDRRDKIFRSTQYKSLKSIPNSIDLRDKMPRVFDQGKIGSCTANALATLMEYNMIQKMGRYQTLSRLFLYYQERAIEGTVTEDSGAYPRDGFKALHKIGIPLEKYWPYRASMFAVKPSKTAYKYAERFKIDAYFRVKSLANYKVCIAEGRPVAVGFNVYESFESEAVAKTGMVPMPTRGEKRLGGHEVLGIGYDDSRKLAIFRNSWGRNWGDQGNFYLPYPVFRRLVTDMWTGK